MTSVVEPARLLELARERFGVDRFRPGQRELIEAVLRGENALGVLPTGAGKSLTYQLPALVLSRPVLVVSPLISLMQDQQDKLSELAIPVAKLNSTLKAAEERKVNEELERGAAELIYVTPERLENASYLELLRKQRIALLVIDEAHCVAQWGHDFRPAYLALRDAARELGRPPVLALTATATPEVIDDILKQLAIPDARIVQLGVERKNLWFDVVRTPRAGQKRDYLRRFLAEEQGGGIIYVATVRKAVELQRWLVQEGCSAGLYHGKLKASEREDTQHRFMGGELRLMVATNAFGLGIDKSDLRFVIHYNFPDSVESYYQEAGRAGRDGKPARAILLYRLEDKRLQSFFLGGRYPRREESVRFIEHIQRLDAERGAPTIAELAQITGIPERRAKVIAAQLESVGLVTRRRQRVVPARQVRDAEELERLLSDYESRRKSDRERLELMMRYAQTVQCRTRYLQRYFGEESEQDCGHCDNCQRQQEAPDALPQTGAAGSAPLEGERLERLIASAIGHRPEDGPRRPSG